MSSKFVFTFGNYIQEPLLNDIILAHLYIFIWYNINVVTNARNTLSNYFLINFIYGHESSKNGCFQISLSMNYMHVSVDSWNTPTTIVLLKYSSISPFIEAISPPDSTPSVVVLIPLSPNIFLIALSSSSK